MMSEHLQNLFGYINDLSMFLSEVLTPFINLILVASALIIVLSCVYSAVEHVTKLRKHRDALSALALGADVIAAKVLLCLTTVTNPLAALYLVATAAVAIAIRMGVAKLSK